MAQLLLPSSLRQLRYLYGTPLFFCPTRSNSSSDLFAFRTAPTLELCTTRRSSDKFATANEFMESTQAKLESTESIPDTRLVEPLSARSTTRLSTATEVMRDDQLRITAVPMSPAFVNTETCASFGYFSCSSAYTRLDFFAEREHPEVLSYSCETTETPGNGMFLRPLDLARYQ